MGNGVLSLKSERQQQQQQQQQQILGRIVIEEKSSFYANSRIPAQTTIFPTGAGAMENYAPASLTQLSNDKNESSLHHNYLFEYYLGRGSASTVFLGKNKINNEDVAIKRMSISDTLTRPQGINSLINELSVIKRMGTHPNIVKIHAAYRHEKYCYFVMDYLIGGDLREFILHQGSLTQQSIAYIISSIGFALNHLHQRQIIHRDVKPENIGFDSKGKPYLLDFGISYSISDLNTSSFVCTNSSGTISYLAPEVLTPFHRHSYQADYWSLGVVAYELVYNQLPFIPHVPKNYISYVTSHYDFLTHENYLSVTSNYEGRMMSNSSQTLIAPPSSRATSPTYSDNLITLQSDRIIPLYLIHSYPITRNPLPLPTDSLDLVQNEMIELLSGLLDLRIPYRLGAIERFYQFTHQSIFMLYGYHDSNRLQSISSPLYSETRNSLFTLSKPSRLLKIDNNCYQEDSVDQFDDSDHFNSDIENKLNDIFPYLPFDATPSTHEDSSNIKPDRKFDQNTAIVDHQVHSRLCSSSHSDSSDENEKNSAYITSRPLFNPSPTSYQHLI